MPTLLKAPCIYSTMLCSMLKTSISWECTLGVHQSCNKIFFKFYLYNVKFSCQFNVLLILLVNISLVHSVSIYYLCFLGTTNMTEKHCRFFVACWMLIIGEYTRKKKELFRFPACSVQWFTSQCDVICKCNFKINMCIAEFTGNG